jgi:ectoine hydroxylase-related dioxygenase (phytanoyl-CoA dioxygenase family)
MSVTALSAAERDTFRQQGYLGPYSLCSAAEMDGMRPGIEAVLASEAPDHKTREHNRHLDSRLVHELAVHPAILDRMAALYGEDLLIWRTNFFVKDPVGGDLGVSESPPKEIPWHQDFNYWPLEPPVIISAWIAIDPSTRANGCVQVLPGSHRKPLPHIKAGEDMVFAEMADPDSYDASGAVDLEMEPGQFVLFNERTLHHSEPNRSAQRRIGLAVRAIVPLVQVLSWDSPAHALVLARGRDRLGFNRTTEPPKD